ncbi:MAG: tRNA (guanosine(37)-N1)-methyltransferase TrmD [Deltaproteobacteria bacterium]|nr:tRNA (guanosine(37)-N1)-methyltransferase TrmD [Deltaproteobacteria bacterium]
MRVHVVTIFPEFFVSPLAVGIPKRARDAGLLHVSLVDLREYTHDRHRTTDDTPYGGGHGMVMKVGPIVEALDAIAAAAPNARRVLLSPRGPALDHRKVLDLARGEDLVLVCGRYEGVDERVRDFVDEELSIGDYVLSGGEPAALAVIDAVVRQLPGALGNVASAASESFVDDRLEYPQYTRPEVFRGRSVPAVLLSGDHAAIADWRAQASREVTARTRPDLLARAPARSE